MKHKSIRRMFNKVYKKAFDHIPKPSLAIFDGTLYGMCVGKGKTMVVLFTEEHESTGEMIDTILHELAHAEQAHEGSPLLDNKDHKRRVAKAWERFLS